MKNVFFLLLAAGLFGFAFYIYWIVAQENGVKAVEATRSMAPRGAPGGTELTAFLNQWQPYLTLASSLGGHWPRNWRQ